MKRSCSGCDLHTLYVPYVVFLAKSPENVYHFELLSRRLARATLQREWTHAVQILCFGHVMLTMGELYTAAAMSA